MKKYILILPVFAFLLSCGSNENNSAFSITYDFNKKTNDFKLINLHTINTENSNGFSTIDSKNVHSFGVQFNTDSIINANKVFYKISAKIRKEDTDSKTALVLSATNDTNKVIVWNTVQINFEYISENNKWTEFSYDKFSLPTDIPSNSDVRIYFWSTDGKKVDIDDFKFEILK